MIQLTCAALGKTARHFVKHLKIVDLRKKNKMKRESESYYSFSNDFMFCTVLYQNKDLCKELIEVLLDEFLAQIFVLIKHCAKHEIVRKTVVRFRFSFHFVFLRRSIIFKRFTKCRVAYPNAAQVNCIINRKFYVTLPV